MPRANAGPRLRLYGPDTKYGAKAKRGYTDYTWYIVWTEGGRKRERATGAGRLQRSAADESLADFLARQDDAGRTGPRGPDQVTISDVIAMYASTHGPETAAPWRIAYAGLALTAWWKDAPVSAITAATCRRYVKERRAGMRHHHHHIVRNRDGSVTYLLATGRRLGDVLLLKWLRMAKRPAKRVSRYRPSFGRHWRRLTNYP